MYQYNQHTSLSQALLALRKLFRREADGRVVETQYSSTVRKKDSSIGSIQQTAGSMKRTTGI